VKLDEAVLEELERAGAGTAKEIGERLSGCVYEALKRLVKADRVTKDGYPGQGNEKTYSLKLPTINRRL
jgi:hypothetical protein